MNDQSVVTFIELLNLPERVSVEYYWHYEGDEVHKSGPYYPLLSRKIMHTLRVGESSSWYIMDVEVPERGTLIIHYGLERLLRGKR